MATCQQPLSLGCLLCKMGPLPRGSKKIVYEALRVALGTLPPPASALWTPEVAPWLRTVLVEEGGQGASLALMPTGPPAS